MKSQGKKRWTPWSFMDLVSRWFYGLLRRSFLGRWLTAYGRIDGRMRSQDHDAGVRPLSGWRQRMVRVMEKSPLVRGLKIMVQALFDIPMSMIGLFGVTYGLAGAGGLLLYNIHLLRNNILDMELDGFLRYGLIVLLACPLLFSNTPLSRTLYRCKWTRMLLIWLLGVPKDRFFRPVRSMWRGLPVLMVVSAILTGGASSQMGRFSVFDGISVAWHPWLVPVTLFVVALLGMVITVPETGVVLSCCCMAFLWLHTDWALWLLLGLIGATWVGYLVQVLQAHRTLRFDLLDRVVLLFGVAVLLGGLAGYGAGWGSAQRAIVMSVLLSLYFPIVNLMVTRTHVKRCWVGACITAVLATLSMVAGYVYPAEREWTTAVLPQTGELLSNGFAGFLRYLTDGNASWHIVFLVMMVPLLLAFLIRSNRLLYQVALGGLILADITLILLSGSLGACAALLIALLIFCFVGHHRTLTVGVFVSPVFLAGWLVIPHLPDAWMQPYHRVVAWLTSWEGLYAERYQEGIFAIFSEHPFGIGMGEKAFEELYAALSQTGPAPTAGTGSLYLDILLGLGISGLLVFALMIVLFVQKSLTMLRYSGGRADRVLILGGLSGMAGLLILGFARSMGDSVALFFGFWMILAVLCAYENVVETETVALQVRSMETTNGQDYIGRID